MATRRLTRTGSSRLDSRAAASAGRTSMVVGRRHASVQKLTDQVLELCRTAGRGDVEARVTIGGLLRDVKLTLEHGDWLTWLEEEVPYGDRTARGYIDLFDWTQQQPTLYEHVAPLGTTKVIMLSRISPARLRGLLRPKRHQLPNGGPKLTLEQMTATQLASVLALTPTLETSADAAMSSYRRRVTGLLRATEELVALGDEVDRDRIEEMHDDLVVATAQLADHFLE